MKVYSPYGSTTMKGRGVFGVVAIMIAMASTWTSASSTAYKALTFPGTIQAADFDNGGEGVAYHDTTPGNTGGGYRATDVDIAWSTNLGSWCIGWMEAGEWMLYTINVQAAGPYTLSARVATPLSGARAVFQLNGSTFATLDVPNTGGWDKWADVSTTVILPAGTHILTVYTPTGGLNLASLTASSPSGSGPQTPHLGTALPIPGTFQAADFDNGGEGISYHDTSRGNSGGAYRDGDVDIAICPSLRTTCVGWIDIGEWLLYSVNVRTSGTYDFALKVASPSSTSNLDIQIDGAQPPAASLSLPGTGAWDAFVDVHVSLKLTAGPHVLTFYTATGGYNIASITTTLTTSGTATDGGVAVVTTADRRDIMVSQPIVMNGGIGVADYQITVDNTVQFQQILGFGGTLSEGGAKIINDMPPASKQSLMTALFDPTRGLGLSFFRQPLGANDFALSTYSYEDVFGAFSAQRDSDNGIIGILQAGKILNPNVQIMLTPWGPPAWAKSNGHMAGANSQFVSDAGVLTEFSKYLVKSVTAWQTAGIPVYAVTMTNEPEYATDGYPSALMSMYPGQRTTAGFSTSVDQMTLLNTYVGPAFQAAGLAAKLFVLDHNFDYIDDALTLLADAKARRFSGGVALHCYGGDSTDAALIQARFPDQEVLATECSTGTWTPSWGEQLLAHSAYWVSDTLRAGARAVVTFNLALDEHHGPNLDNLGQTGPCFQCTSFAVVPTTGADWYPDRDYFIVGQISRFVKPGAYRIASDQPSDGMLKDVAFVNPDGSTVLYAVNLNETDRKIRVHTRQGTFDFTMPARSVVTFQWALP